MTISEDTQVLKIVQLAWSLGMKGSDWEKDLEEYKKGTLQKDRTLALNKLFEFAEEVVEDAQDASVMPKEVLNWFEQYRDYLPTVAEEDFVALRDKLRLQSELSRQVRGYVKGIEKLREPLEQMEDAVRLTQLQLNEFSRMLDKDYYH